MPFGWLNWLGAETVGVLVAIFNLLWVPVVAFAGIAVPDKVLTLPILVTFAVSVLHFTALYRRRVPIPALQAAGAMVAAMAMQWTVARAVAHGLVKDHFAFVRTAKGGGRPRRTRWLPISGVLRGLIGGLLLFGALSYSRPITSACARSCLRQFSWCRAFRSSPPQPRRVRELPANDFAPWRSLEARLLEVLPREFLPRRDEIETAAAAPEKIEAAQ